MNKVGTTFEELNDSHLQGVVGGGTPTTVTLTEASSAPCLVGGVSLIATGALSYITTRK